ncbi:serpin family protein [Arthrobacter ginkgonis]|uniref:Serpin family protein n=1 Tax=Arthrobacter ginkgonis TaxID=1630594 RepID=A0ABP7CMF0_9MICC
MAGEAWSTMGGQRSGRGPRRAGLAILAASALALGGCAGPTTPGPPAPEQVRADVERATLAVESTGEGVEQLRGTARTLGATLLAAAAEDGQANAVTSPASLLLALAMLRVGAEGRTAEEMDSVLGWGDGSADAANAVLAAWEEFDGDPASVKDDEPPARPLLHLANGVFVDKATPTGEPFLEGLGRNFGAGVYPVDYADPATGQAIDAWVSENTGGRIEKAPLDWDPDTTLSLLNAVFFAAAWETPFPADTLDADFTTASGEVVRVPTMYRTGELRHAEADGWRIVELPYNEGFLMRLALPPEGVAPAAGADTLAALEAAAEAAPSGELRVGLPKFDFNGTLQLVPALKALGLERTLGSEPDLDAIQPGAVVTGIAQSGDIVVAEKGTVAAAVTQIGIEATSVPLPVEELLLDRPFLYQIVDTRTGLPLFLGTVGDPR